MKKFYEDWLEMLTKNRRIKKTVIAGQESKLSPLNLRLCSTLEAVDGETEASKASERVPQ